MLRPIAAPSPSVNLEAIIAPPWHGALWSPMGNLRSLPCYLVCSLVGYAFRDLRQNYTDNACLSERAILVAKNLDVDAINFKIQQSLPGNETTFKSIDPVVDPDEVVNYPVEF
ncbi:ATP-dependent DNA helicase [Trichonephila clavipes]|nr:ATP-dependent DNA helicase [Trichonephila clavipes]